MKHLMKSIPAGLAWFIFSAMALAVCFVPYVF